MRRTDGFPVFCGAWIQRARVLCAFARFVFRIPGDANAGGCIVLHRASRVGQIANEGFAGAGLERSRIDGAPWWSYGLWDRAAGEHPAGQQPNHAMPGRHDGMPVKAYSAAAGTRHSPFPCSVAWLLDKGQIDPGNIIPSLCLAPRQHRPKVPHLDSPHKPCVRNGCT